MGRMGRKSVNKSPKKKKETAHTAGWSPICARQSLEKHLKRKGVTKWGEKGGR